MQSGFFDELLKEEEQTQETEESVVSDSVQATDNEDDTVELNFADFTKENESKVEINQDVKEEVKVEEQKVEVKREPKRKTPKPEPQIAKNSSFSNENVDLPKEESKTQLKPNNVAKMSVQPVKKDFTQMLIESTLNKINDITSFSNEIFTTRARNCAMDIITSLDHVLNERGMTWNVVDSKGSNLIMQIKQWAKLGVDCSNDKLYPDIRRNNKTGMYDIKVKGQYQTVEKLIAKYCNKNIFRFKTEVICIGDDFKCDFDYATGEDKVISFTKNMKVDRNKLDNIIGAFKIIYYYDDDNKIHQIVTKIEKDRIMRAYNAAQTKNVWNTDTQKMVKKTVTWEMFNGEDIRPFMDYPDDIIDDLRVVNDNEEVDFNKEHKFSNVVDAQNNVEETLGTDESVGF